MLKSDIKWPPHRRFKSRTDWEPIGFFSECLCNSTQFDLMLGFFSSSAISVLSDGFATFLYKGGRMRLIINDILTDQDRIAISNGINQDEIPFFDITNISNLKKTLSERDSHFFNCLAWLIRNDRLEIKIIAPKDSIGISHTKSGVFSDGLNVIAFDGSCNFSRTALVNNIESLTVSCDWDGTIEKAKIDNLKEDFDSVFNGNNENVNYIAAENIKTKMISHFEDKKLADLLFDENKLLQGDLDNKIMPKSVIKALEKAKNKVEVIIEKLKVQNEQSFVSDFVCTESKFPYSSGPREYQKKAFENWKNNKQKGLFAMATGTGKTITALNCLLEIFKKSGYYKSLILVPTITLVDQWESECKKFNFDNIIKICSKTKNWKSRISNIRLMEISDSDNKFSYIIISTYASFVRSNIFSELIGFPKNKLLFIADEAHNMGSGQLKNRLDEIPYLRRIGLSATPERQFDETGNKKLMEFFGCASKYTFEYSMKDAIENGALCKYYYYPHVINLTDLEMDDYKEISTKIAKMMEFQDEESQDILLRLLLKRKRIIHKAENKAIAFRNIMKDRLKENGNLKYTLVYVPEGNKPDNEFADVFDKTDFMENDDDSDHLIDNYTRIVKDLNTNIIVRQFTSDSKDRDKMLKEFAEGRIDVLTSMKCLDEGIDVPRSEFAVFCSSTGNPRQFIQRRGRVLRTHKDKSVAIIHDLVVIPNHHYFSENYELEKSLVSNELKRVRDFALLSENLFDTDRELEDVLNYYNLSIFK